MAVFQILRTINHVAVVIPNSWHRRSHWGAAVVKGNQFMRFSDFTPQYEYLMAFLPL